MPMVIKDLGPSVVIWDEPGDNVTFSKTFGGVIFRYEELQVAVKRDQAGETEVDGVTVGVANPELEVPLTQEENRMLNYCFANSQAAITYLRVSNPVGARILPLTRQVIVKPIEDGVISVTATEWLYLHRAFPRVTGEWNYDVANQRVVKVLFKGYPDDISGRQNRLFDFGTP